MGFDITPQGVSSTLLCVFIDYALPQTLPARWFGYLFGNFYARWCTRRMVGDAAKHFNHCMKDSVLP